MVTLRNLLISAIILISLVKATDVLVVSEQNYPDSAVAYAVAQKYGYGVVVVEGMQASQEELQKIAEFSPQNVYIIGGPAVISEEFENAIKNYNSSWLVSRVYGITKYGTSAEVAKKFFVSSEKAVVVTDKPDYPAERGNYKLVTLASKLAGFYGVPLLITPEESIAVEIEEALRALGVKEVLLIGNVSLKAELENIGIKVTVLNEVGVKNKIEEKVRERERAGEKVPLVIICIRNATDSNAAALMSGHVLLVRSPEEVNVTFVKEFERVKVLGYPECALNISNLLNASGIKVETVSGRKVYEIARKVVKEIKEEVEDVFKKLKQEREKVIREKANETIEEAKEKFIKLLTINCSVKIDVENIEKRLNMSIEAYQQGKYGEAFGLANSVIAEIKNYFWKCRNETDEVEILREREKVAFRDYFKKIREVLPPVCLRLKIANINITELNESEARKVIPLIKKFEDVCKIVIEAEERGISTERIRKAVEERRHEEIRSIIRPLTPY